MTSTMGVGKGVAVGVGVTVGVGVSVAVAVGNVVEVGVVVAANSARVSRFVAAGGGDSHAVSATNRLYTSSRHRAECWVASSVQYTLSKN